MKGSTVGEGGSKIDSGIASTRELEYEPWDCLKIEIVYLDQMRVQTKFIIVLTRVSSYESNIQSTMLPLATRKMKPRIHMMSVIAV